MDVSMINAWRIHQAVAGEACMNRLTFMESVMVGLIGGQGATHEAAEPAPKRVQVDPKSPLASTGPPPARKAAVFSATQPEEKGRGPALYVNSVECTFMSSVLSCGTAKRSK